MAACHIVPINQSAQKQGKFPEIVSQSGRAYYGSGLPILLIIGLVAGIVVFIARRMGYGRRTPGGLPPAPIVGEG